MQASTCYKTHRLANQIVANLGAALFLRVAEAVKLGLWCTLNQLSLQPGLLGYVWETWVSCVI
jgi:hypothetical protein